MLLRPAVCLTFSNIFRPACRIDFLPASQVLSAHETHMRGMQGVFIGAKTLSQFRRSTWDKKSSIRHSSHTCQKVSGPMSIQSALFQCKKYLSWCGASVVQWLIPVCKQQMNRVYELWLDCLCRIVLPPPHCARLPALQNYMCLNLFTRAPQLRAMTGLDIPSARHGARRSWMPSK